MPVRCWRLRFVVGISRTTINKELVQQCPSRLQHIPGISATANIAIDTSTMLRMRSAIPPTVAQIEIFRPTLCSDRCSEAYRFAGLDFGHRTAQAHTITRIQRKMFVELPVKFTQDFWVVIPRKAESEPGRRYTKNFARVRIIAHA